MSHIAHLSKDKKLHRIIQLQQVYVLTKSNHIYFHLCNSIMSQQLSTKVADVFQQRFLALYKNNIPSAKKIANTPFETLRGIGLSNAKANYVHNVCNFFIQHKLTDASLHKMKDDELIQLLTQIKGVGKWTVEMILMFVLGRENIFAIDDLVIQQSICKLYKIDAGNKKEMKQKIIKIAAKWSPYSTYACKYLWGWKDKA